MRRFARLLKGVDIEVFRRTMEAAGSRAVAVAVAAAAVQHGKSRGAFEIIFPDELQKSRFRVCLFCIFKRLFWL